MGKVILAHFFVLVNRISMSKKNNSKCEFKYIERTVEGVDLRTICKITTSEC